MCGIFGWQFDTSPGAGALTALAAVLAINNEERGAHSWGYATHVGRGGVRKGVGPLTANVPAPLLAAHRSILVHTRYKTHGAVSVENAHPFIFGPIVGAHNGIIWNTDELNATHRRAFDVDSQHIFAHLAESRGLGELEGYGAIEYLDAREPGAIFLGRFDVGELAACRVAGGVVWSSERAHLEQACIVAGLTPEHWYKVKRERLYIARNGRLTCTATRLPVRDWYYGNGGGGGIDSWRDYASDENARVVTMVPAKGGTIGFTPAKEVRVCLS